jgi:mannitol-specific phosphotransferase system IIBC component
MKSPKSKVQSLKSIKNVVLSFVIFLFLTGCVITQEYVYKDDTFKKEEKKVEENRISEEKEERKQKWIGSYLEENDFTKQCPVCKRRYQDFLEKCPYDGAKLEEITR